MEKARVRIVRYIQRENPKLKYRIDNVFGTSVPLFYALVFIPYESKEQAIEHLKSVSEFNGIELVPEFV